MEEKKKRWPKEKGKWEEDRRRDKTKRMGNKEEDKKRDEQELGARERKTKREHPRKHDVEMTGLYENEELGKGSPYAEDM